MSDRCSTKKIKVCHVTSAHSRYDVRIFQKECKSLAYNGFDVLLLVNDNLPNELIDGVKIVSTQLNPKNRFERMIKSKKQIRRHMLEIDAEIYHFHDPELLPEAAWIKRMGKIVVFDFHEDVSQQIIHKVWIPAPIRRIISTLYKVYEKRLVGKFDSIITVTPKFVERLKKINSNTILITNYPIANTKTEPDYTRKKRAVCFAGGISPQWSHEIIIDAIGSIDDIEYILAGSGAPEYIEKLKMLKGWSRVRYLGIVPHEKVKDIYDESIIGMSLLSYETQVGNEGTLGNTKIFEFMEAGIPVICSDNKLWKQIIETHDCGIAINPTDVEQIRNSIKYLIQNNDRRIEMGLNGKEAIKNDFNWNSQEDRLIQTYLEL